MAQVATLHPQTSRDGAIRSELMKIVRERSFRQGRFTLSSGVESDLYFNMKPTMMNSRGAELSARNFMSILAGLDFKYIGGLEMGAVPVIGSIAALSSAERNNIETIFVRKKQKEHGTRDLIEGLSIDETLKGSRVVVIDDVATTGKSFLQAVSAMREAGGQVDSAACIVDREEGAAEFLAEFGVKLYSIFKGSEFRSR